MDFNKPHDGSAPDDNWTDGAGPGPGAEQGGSNPNPPSPPPGTPMRRRIAPPPPPPKKQGGSLWMWFLMMGLLLVLGISLLFNVLFIASDVAPGVGFSAEKKTDLQETVLLNHHAHEKILIIDVNGVISGNDWSAPERGLVRMVKDQLYLAERDERVRAVVLKIDSPGGEVLASDQIYEALEDFQESTGKPVVASMGSLAASGGYYIAAPCHWIVAHPLTITGSVGVIMRGYNYRQLMDKLGVVPQVYKSGEFKDMLSGEKPLSEVSDEEQEMMNRMIQETYQRFKQVVREGRQLAKEKNGDEGRALADDWESYVDGRIWSGRQAYELGFVDELGGMDEAVSRAKELADIEEANLIQYKSPMEFGDFFKIFGKSSSSATTIRVDLGLDQLHMDAGHLYFLWMP